MLKLISSLFLVGCLSGMAWAQNSPSAVVSTPQLRAELVAHAPQGVQAGQPLWVGLLLTHQPEWHTYWRNPGDSGLPTQIELNLPAGITAGDVQWPLPHKLKAGNLTNYGFERTVLLAVPLTVSKQFKANSKQGLDIQLHANWLVCRLECIPQEGDFELRIPVNSSFAAQAAEFEDLMAQQPQVLSNTQASISFEAQHLVMQVSGLPSALHGKTLSLFPEAAELVESAAEQHPLANQTWHGDVWTVKLPLSAMRATEPKSFGALMTLDERDQRQGFLVSGPVTTSWPKISDIPTSATPAVQTPETDQSWVGFALAVAGAFVGGLILNLMPCVLPVLAIKLLGFAQHSRAHRAHRLAGMAYTAGVVLSFLALGAGVLVLRAAGEQLGWGFQLQSPAVVSVLAAFFSLIALNLFGLFEFGQILPSRIASFQYKHPVMDAGLSGVLAVAVASPCTAPFMGASLGLAMTLPTWQALTIFAAMGLGLAAPYLLASFMPAVARLLPHPGPWMITLRQLLAFPILATVIWLLWVLGQQTSLDAAMFALSGLLLLAALIWSLKQQTPAARGLAWFIAAVLVWGGFSFAEQLNAPSTDATASISSSSTTSTPTQSSPNVAWLPWSEVAVAQSLAQGRPVFVDFTAAWCVTCQINKKSTLSNNEVLSDFASHQVTLMRADWTRRDPAISVALSVLGRSGVPVYVLYAQGKAPLVLSELLSVSKMKEALATLPDANPAAPATGFALPLKPKTTATITRN
jgi:thiol:disulfide interchange protein/DsbC/DsbD-like thiol-disulfide interchange protein